MPIPNLASTQQRVRDRRSDLCPPSPDVRQHPLGSRNGHQHPPANRLDLMHIRSRYSNTSKKPAASSPSRALINAVLPTLKPQILCRRPPFTKGERLQLRTTRRISTTMQRFYTLSFLLMAFTTWAMHSAHAQELPVHVSAARAEIDWAARG